MKTETLDKIKQLLSHAKTLRVVRENYKTTIEDSSCDKYDMSFTKKDSRFASFKCSVLLTSYTGYFGNSNCTTFFRLDNDLAQASLERYLDQHMGQVFEWMAQDMENEAKKLTNQAEAEIARMQELLSTAIEVTSEPQ